MIDDTCKGLHDDIRIIDSDWQCLFNGIRRECYRQGQTTK